MGLMPGFVCMVIDANNSLNQPVGHLVAMNRRAEAKVKGHGALQGVITVAGPYRKLSNASNRIRGEKCMDIYVRLARRSNDPVIRQIAQSMLSVVGSQQAPQQNQPQGLSTQQALAAIFPGLAGYMQG